MKFSVVIAALILSLAACTKSSDDETLVDTPSVADTANYMNFRVDGIDYRTSNPAVQVTRPTSDPNYVFSITGNLPISSSPTEYRRLEIEFKGGTSGQLSKGGITNFSALPNMANYSYYRDPFYIVNTDTCVSFGFIVNSVGSFVRNSISYYTATGTFSGVLRKGTTFYNISNGRYHITYMRP